MLRTFSNLDIYLVKITPEVHLPLGSCTDPGQHQAQKWQKPHQKNSKKFQKNQKRSPEKPPQKIRQGGCPVQRAAAATHMGGSRPTPIGSRLVAGGCRSASQPQPPSPNRQPLLPRRRPALLLDLRAHFLLHFFPIKGPLSLLFPHTAHFSVDYFLKLDSLSSLFSKF